MPKPKPTEVIRHEIIFGKVERELLENATTSGALMGLAKDVLPYFKDVASAIAFIEAVATLLELFGIETPIPTPIDAIEFFQGIEQKKELFEQWAEPGPLAGAIVQDELEAAGINICDAPLTARLAAAGYAPTQWNMLRFYLFGPLPGMAVCP
jgi:hypothetical protein